MSTTPSAPGNSDRSEQPATTQRGPHRDRGADRIGRGRDAGANSPLDPKTERERAEAPEQRASPVPKGSA